MGLKYCLMEKISKGFTLGQWLEGVSKSEPAVHFRVGGAWKIAGWLHLFVMFFLFFL